MILLRCHLTESLSKPNFGMRSIAAHLSIHHVHSDTGIFSQQPKIAWQHKLHCAAGYCGVPRSYLGSGSHHCYRSAASANQSSTTTSKTLQTPPFRPQSPLKYALSSTRRICHRCPRYWIMPLRSATWSLGRSVKIEKPNCFVSPNK
jgi:hypothetical protein